jgi:hypothetical protein
MHHEFVGEVAALARLSHFFSNFIQNVSKAQFLIFE